MTDKKIKYNCVNKTYQAFNETYFQRGNFSKTINHHSSSALLQFQSFYYFLNPVRVWRPGYSHNIFEISQWPLIHGLDSGCFLPTVRMIDGVSSENLFFMRNQYFLDQWTSITFILLHMMKCKTSECLRRCFWTSIFSNSDLGEIYQVPRQFGNQGKSKKFHLFVN